MDKYKWSKGDYTIVACPNCGFAVEEQISVVKEMDLPLRPAECDECGCDFNIFHDGRTELLRVPPKESNPTERKEILDKFNNLVFDPDFEDDIKENAFALAQDVNRQLSIIMNAFDKKNTKEIISEAAGEIQSLVQKHCIDRSY
ncbi:hypothetical protein EH030_20745 [Salmonella enterica]|nr:hypothetical protein [Salmonella enterica]